MLRRLQRATFEGTLETSLALSVQIGLIASPPMTNDQKSSIPACCDAVHHCLHVSSKLRGMFWSIHDPFLSAICEVEMQFVYSHTH